MIYKEIPKDKHGENGEKHILFLTDEEIMVVNELVGCTHSTGSYELEWDEKVDNIVENIFENIHIVCEKGINEIVKLTIGRKV